MAQSGCPEHRRLVGHVKPPGTYACCSVGTDFLHCMEWSGPYQHFQAVWRPWEVGWHHVFAWWKKGQSLLHGAIEAACLYVYAQTVHPSSLSVLVMLQGEEDTVVHKEQYPFFNPSFLVLACRYLVEAPLNTEMPAEINYDYLPL